MLEHTLALTLLIILFIVSYYPTLFQIILAHLGKFSSTGLIRGARDLKKLVVLLPVKREPVSLVREFLERNRHFLRKVSLVCIVAEGYSDLERKQLEKLTDHFQDIRIRLIFQESSRNKAQALNRALACLNIGRDVLIMVLDVDSRVTSLPDLLPEIATPVWHGYARIKSKLGLGQVLGYYYYDRVIEGIGRATGWYPLLGSGLVISLDILERLGMFNENVILEDVELSLRAYSKGYTINYLPSLRVEVQVPSTYTGFIRQQCRWAYGTMQLVRIYARFLLRRPLVLLYLLQYVSYPAHMLLTCTLYLECVLHLLPPPPLQIGLLCLAACLLGIYTYTLCKLTPHIASLREKLIAINRINMAYTIAAPRLLVDLAKGLLGLSYTWIPTPKLEQVTSLSYRLRLLKPEVSQSLVLLSLALACLLKLSLALLISSPLLLLAFSYTASAIWGTVRALQRELT